MRIFPIPLILTLILSTAFSGFLQVGAIDATTTGTAFTYEGQLLDDNGPINAACDFTFSLWNKASGGTQIGSTQDVDNVSIANGLFIVTLNDENQFGPAAFDGSPRWLAVGVRCPSGSGEYTTLSPRQALAPAPYAMYSSAAPWSGLAGMPGGFADGIDNDTQYSAGEGLLLAGTSFSLDETSLINLIEENHDNWFTTILSTTIIENPELFSGTYQLAISGICPAGAAIRQVNADGTVACETDDNTTYSAGEGLSLSGTTFNMSGTSYAQVLVVAKSGGDFTSIQSAINSISDASASKRYLVWIGPGTYSEVVTLKNYVDLQGAGPDLTTISVVSGYGIAVYGMPYATLRDLAIIVSGTPTDGYGIYADNLVSGDGFPNLRNVWVTITGGSTSRAGIYGYDDTNHTAILEDVRITISSGSPTTAIGIYVLDGALEIHNLVASLSAGSSRMGLAVTSAGSITARESVITASTYTIYNFGGAIHVMNTMLSGGPVFSQSSGTTCNFVVDEGYASYPSACP